jgi:DNA-binding CsgD family transcriptional regulator
MTEDDDLSGDQPRGPSGGDSSAAPSTPNLTPRQVECLVRIEAGKTSAQIAADFGISKRTVDEHVRDACRKLGVKRRPEAVAKSIRLGLIPAVGPRES